MDRRLERIERMNFEQALERTEQSKDAFDIAHRAYQLLAEAVDPREAIPQLWLEAALMKLDRSSIPYVVLEHFDYLWVALADAFDWDFFFGPGWMSSSTPPLRAHFTDDEVRLLYASCVILCAGLLIASTAAPAQHDEVIASWHAQGLPTVGELSN